MSRFTFAALASFVLSAAAAAQQVPGRDLLDFPVGLLAEPAPLSMQMTAGLWNPATSALGPHRRSAIGFAGLTTDNDQGVRIDMLGGAYQARPGITASMSFTQASVSDIPRTLTDPQSKGNEIPYGTTLLSAGVATTRRNVTVGLAGRYRWGSLDADRAGAFSLDGGVIVDRLAGTPVRLAVSTFLLSPSRTESTTLFAAADLPLLQRDSTFAVRAGYSQSRTDGRGREDYVFGTSEYRRIDLSAGVSRTMMYGNVNSRMRLGLGLHYAGYNIAIGREDGVGGFGASYQFLFTRVFP